MSDRITRKDLARAWAEGHSAGREEPSWDYYNDCPWAYPLTPNPYEKNEA